MADQREQLIRVVLVEDHPITREGLRAVLERDPGIPAVTVVGEADSVATAQRLVEAERPDVVLADLRLGADGGCGIELVDRLRTLTPQVRLLVVSQAAPAEVLAAIRAGAHGYVGKSATSAELLGAVRAVLTGPVVPPELAAHLIGQLRSAPDAPALTPREREVLRWVAQGYDNREIAEELVISLRTVNRHLENIRTKLGRNRRSELVRIARELEG